MTGHHNQPITTQTPFLSVSLPRPLSPPSLSLSLSLPPSPPSLSLPLSFSLSLSNLISPSLHLSLSLYFTFTLLQRKPTSSSLQALRR